MYRAIDHRFEVVCNDAALSDLIDEVFAHCVDDVVDAVEVESIEVTVDGGTTTFGTDEGDRTVPTARALQGFVSLVNSRGAHRRPDALPVLHGGAVSFGGEAVLVLGRSGSGKSSLVAGLCADGGEYLADELVALPSPTCVAGYPKSITLKDGAWDVIGIDRPTRPSGARRFVTDVEYLPAELLGASTVLDQALPTAIVFPTYDPGAAGCMTTALEPMDALLRCAESAYAPLRPEAFFELGRLVGRVPAFAVRYGASANERAEVHRIRTAEGSAEAPQLFGPSVQPSAVSVVAVGEQAVVLAPDGTLTAIAGFSADMWSAAEQDPDHPLHHLGTS